MGVPAGYRVISEMSYTPQPLTRGYTGQTLYVNVGSGKIESRPVTQQMKDLFVGGKGFGLWRLWNAVTSKTRWDDPENEIVVASGPVGGTTAYAGSGKSLVVSLSPLTGQVIDSNVGGYFGPYLKFSGWDALELQGKAREDIVVFIDGTKGVVDLSRIILGKRPGVFAALQDPSVFARVRIEYGAATWDGEIDIAPDAMYEVIKKDGVWTPD